MSFKYTSTPYGRQNSYDFYGRNMQHHTPTILVPGITLIKPDEEESILLPCRILKPIPTWSAPTRIARKPVPRSENIIRSSLSALKFSTTRRLSRRSQRGFRSSSALTSLFPPTHFDGTVRGRKKISKCRQTLSGIMEATISTKRIRLLDVAERTSQRVTGLAWKSIDKIVNMVSSSPPSPSNYRGKITSPSFRKKYDTSFQYRRPLPLRTSGYTPTKITTITYHPLRRQDTFSHRILQPVPWSAKRGRLRYTTGRACLYAEWTCPVQNPFDGFHFPLPAHHSVIERLWLELVARKGWNLKAIGELDVGRKWGAVYGDAKERFVREREDYWEEIWRIERNAQLDERRARNSAAAKATSNAAANATAGGSRIYRAGPRR